MHINKIETRTAINYIIAPDKYQALSWDPTVGLFGFPAQVNTVRAEKLHAYVRRSIHQTFGNQKVQAVFDIPNIWPLKINVFKQYITSYPTKFTAGTRLVPSQTFPQHPVLKAESQILSACATENCLQHHGYEASMVCKTVEGIYVLFRFGTIM